jgi:hypothetical protein
VKEAREQVNGFFSVVEAFVEGEFANVGEDVKRSGLRATLRKQGGVDV